MEERKTERAGCEENYPLGFQSRLAAPVQFHASFIPVQITQLLHCDCQYKVIVYARSRVLLHWQDPSCEGHIHDAAVLSFAQSSILDI